MGQIKTKRNQVALNCSAVPDGVNPMDFMQWCPASQLKIQSEQDIQQHFRDLVIRDVVTGKSISLLPDGGFQNGWYVDSSRTCGVYYGISCNEDSNVPIFNHNLLKFHLELE